MTKAELMQYKVIDHELRGLEDALAKLRARMESPSRAAMSVAPSKGVNIDPLGDSIVAYDELMNLYNAKWDKLIDLQRGVELAIEALGPIERTVIRHKHIDGLSIPKIGQKLNYSPRSIDRILKRAYEKLA